MKVLFLTQTTELGPSSRYRVYQLLPLLRERGIGGDVSPAIDSSLYRAIYLGGRASRRAAFFAAWRRRRTDLHRLDGFDAVFIQKGVFPGLHSGFERKIAARKPMVFDLDDAIWLPRQGGSTLLRGLHRESAVQEILRCAAAVIAGNESLAEYARRFNRDVSVVPSVIDTSRYAGNADSPVVGWIGSGTTLPYLKPLATVFKTLGIKPRVIASGDPRVLGFEVDFRPWRLETELAELGQIGVGIAPLPDTPWERGKCGVKLLQYMACSIPVVASPVGVHNQIVRHGVNGFLAAGPAEWESYLSELIANPELRQKLGAAGRQTVGDRYDLRHAAERVGAVLRSLK